MQSIILSMLAVLICISVHESSHAFAAYLLGDKTAHSRGRMTLNPISHIDPIGFIALAFFGFGWAKPVPVDYRNLKKPKRDLALISFAGPLSNILLSIVMFSLIVIFYQFNSLYLTAISQFLYITATMSVGLAVFNLIPIPPLDGSKIVIPFMPQKVRVFFVKYEQFIQFGMLVLLWLGFLTPIFIVLRNYAINLIFILIESLLFFI